MVVVNRKPFVSNDVKQRRKRKSIQNRMLVDMKKGREGKGEENETKSFGCSLSLSLP